MTHSQTFHSRFINLQGRGQETLLFLLLQSSTFNLQPSSARWSPLSSMTTTPMTYPVTSSCPHSQQSQPPLLQLGTTWCHGWRHNGAWWQLVGADEVKQLACYANASWAMVQSQIRLVVETGEGCNNGADGRCSTAAESFWQWLILHFPLFLDCCFVLRLLYMLLVENFVLG